MTGTDYSHLLLLVPVEAASGGRADPGVSGVPRWSTLTGTRSWAEPEPEPVVRGSRDLGQSFPDLERGIPVSGHPSSRPEDRSAWPSLRACASG